MTAQKCPRWPRCACIVQGYVNDREPNGCGRATTSEALAYAASKIAEWSAYAVLFIVPIVLWIGAP